MVEGQQLKQKEQSSKLLLVFSFFTVSVVSGLVYGWPAIRRNLVSEEISSLTETELGAIFTIGSWSTQGGRFLTGITRDRLLGTRYTTALCIFTTAAGTAGVAFADKNSIVELGISVFLVGLGSGAQLCLQPVADLFDERFQGMILASFSGAFQVSGLMFLILMKISKDQRESLGIFALLITVLAIFAIRLLPKNFSVKKPHLERNCEQNEQVKKPIAGEQVGNSKDLMTSQVRMVDPEIQNGPNADTIATANDDEKVSFEVMGVEHLQQNKVFALEEKVPAQQRNNSVLSLIMTWEYFLLLSWFSVELIPLQFYVATIGFQLERKGDDLGWYTSLFSILYASSAAFAPVLGKIADNAGLGVGQAVATVLTSASFFVLSSDTLSLDGHAAGMALYGVGRMMVFGMFFTNIGKRFGYTHYGTLAGLGLIISAIFSLLQYPLIAAAASGSEKIVDVASGAAIVLFGLPYCAWLFFREKKKYMPGVQD